ncbi:unnamed protein product [Penicillium salamii]|nr:unnamed protein product [Penicillium salamii]
MAEQSLPAVAVPGRILPVMSPHHRLTLTDHQQKSVSGSSQKAEISVESVDSTASDFLAAKIEHSETARNRGVLHSCNQSRT